MIEKEDILPDKPGDLIKVALDNLNKVEKDPMYEVNMRDSWHRPFETDTVQKCSVCFSGEVMAKTMNLSRKNEIMPNNFHYKLERKIRALDSFRKGNVEYGLLCLNFRKPDNMLPIFRVESYSHNPRKFKKDMKNMIEFFYGYGL